MEKSLMSILIVEDQEAVAASLAAVLETEGYEKISSVSSAEELLGSLGVGADDVEVRDIDIILMDIGLPGMDGIEACRKIKALKPYEDLPIVMVTAKDEPEALSFAFRAGAVDYIVKPVKKLELIARVGSILKLKHEMDRRKLWEKKLLEATVQLNEAKQVIESLSCKNDSTCISDSRGFNEMFRNEWELATQKESPISLLMINVGCCKDTQEKCEGECAKKCMAMVTEALCNAMKRKRPGDFITRYGCDDYAVVLPTTDVSGALTVAERIKSHLGALDISVKNMSTANKLSVSVGVASSMPSKTSSTKILIAAADEALYFAKKEGGNRIKLAMD